MTLTTNNTRLETWDERDRAYIYLYDLNDKEIFCIWDGEVQDIIDDGFMKDLNDHQGLVDYINNLNK